MTAIYRKEWKLYFCRMFGYVMLALLLFFQGLFTVWFNLDVGSIDPADVQRTMSLLLILLAPCLTALALPSEYRSGTERILFSLPLRTVSIVLGKFFAVSTLFLIPTAVLALTSILLLIFGQAHLMALLLAWLGYALFGLVLLSVCFFLSAFFKRPILSALTGMAVLVGVYLFPILVRLLPGTGVLGAISNGLLLLDPFTRVDNFLYGRLDLGTVLYYLGTTAFFLFLTVGVIERRRRGEERGRAGLTPTVKAARVRQTAISLVLAVLLAAMPLCMGLLPQSVANPALAESEAFSVDATTEAMLHGVQEDVTLYFLCSGGESNASGELYFFLKSYADLSPRVQLRVVDPKRDTQATASFSGADQLGDQSIVVSSAHRYRLISNTQLYYYQNSYFGALSPETYYYYCQLLANEQDGGEALYEFVSTTTALFDGESRLTNAIAYVLDPDVPTAYTLSAAGSSAMDAQLIESLQMNGYDCRVCTAEAEIPADCDLLFFHAPTADLTEAEENALTGYLARGGKLFLTAIPTRTAQPRLAALLAEYGLGLEEEMRVVRETDASYQCTDSYLLMLYPYAFYTHIAPHAATGAFSDTFVCLDAQPIQITDREGVTVTPWLYTSEKGVTLPRSAEANIETDASEAGVYTVGAIAQKNGGGTVLLLSSAEAATSVGNSASEGGNFTLLQNGFDHLTDHVPTHISLLAIELESMALTMEDGMLTAFSLILILLLPLGTLGIGGIRVYLRRKR